MGRKDSKTLGFLPQGAFEQYAHSKTIIVARSGENLAGYLLFRKSGKPVKTSIVHLCVAKAFRGQGIARKLFEYLRDQTLDTLGIGLRCREDFEANKVWAKLSFIPVNTRPGRSKDQNTTLVFWWYDHGHPTLFSVSPEDALTDPGFVRAVLDTNIVLDLEIPDRPYHEEAASLEADWLQTQTEYLITPEAFQEIHRQPVAKVRNTSRLYLQRFKQIGASSHNLDLEVSRLRRLFQWPSNDNTTSDLRHLIYTSLAGVNQFITRDSAILSTAELIEEHLRVRVCNPTEFIIGIDELLRESLYQPERLSGSTIIKTRLGQTDIAGLYKIFRDEKASERKEYFEQTVRSCVAKPDQYESVVYETSEGDKLALTSIKSDQRGLEIKLFRTSNHSFSDTLARHLVSQSVLKSMKLGKELTFCIDSDLSTKDRLSFLENGFFPFSGGLVKLNAHIMGSLEHILSHLNRLAETQHDLSGVLHGLSSRLGETSHNETEPSYSDIERMLWPSKLLDDSITNFVVPIRPVWAKELFDQNLAQNSLFGVNEKLILSWENVYYRSSRPSFAKLGRGSRILWYVSKGDNRGLSVRAITACSVVEEVEVDTPKTLYRKYKRLGVYQFKDLLKITGGDTEKKLMAIRFSGTQIFDKPIPQKQFHQVLVSNGYKANNLQSPLQISTLVFASLYRFGYQLHEER